MAIREDSHIFKWVRLKGANAIDSLLLKGKTGCFPSWHDIKSEGLEETKPNKLLNTTFFTWGRAAWSNRE